MMTPEESAAAFVAQTQAEVDNCLNWMAREALRKQGITTAWLESLDLYEPSPELSAFLDEHVVRPYMDTVLYGQPGGPKT